MANNVNPDPINGSVGTESKTNDYIEEHWDPIVDQKSFVDSGGFQSSYAKGSIAIEEQAPMIRSGIGDQDDLETIIPDEEDIELPFQYAARLRGKKKNETDIYPEIEFDYGIHYKGEIYVEDNEAPFDHRVDAYPGKTMEFTIDEEKPLPVEREWAAELEITHELPLIEMEYAVTWEGATEKESKSNVKDLFIPATGLGQFLGSGNINTWNIAGNRVYDQSNQSRFSGVFAKEYRRWTHYEAEFDLMPLIAGRPSRLPSGTSASDFNLDAFANGRDDDLVGLVFKAQDRNNFYCFMWEGEVNVPGSWRAANNLNGFNINHKENDRNGWPNYVVSSSSHWPAAKWRDHERNAGWKRLKKRIYRVVNGVFQRVNVTDHSGGKGWTLNKLHTVKIKSSGKKVQIFANDAAGREQKVFDFTTAYEDGAFGMCNISQAVAYYDIRVTEWQTINGRVPGSGWDKTKAKKTVASNGQNYVMGDARAKARAATGRSNTKIDIFNVKGIVRDSKKGTISASANGAIVATPNQPKGAGVRKTTTLKKSGKVTLGPDINLPSKAITVFTGGNALFKTELDVWKNKNSHLTFHGQKLTLTKPGANDKEYTFSGGTLKMWNGNPKIEKVKKRFKHKVYAYQGWVQAFMLKDHFNGNKWTKYDLTVQEETVDPEYDEVRIEGSFPNWRVMLKTTEYYYGTYPADIKPNGTVKNTETIEKEIPPMPEHFVHPRTREVMYHGHSDVHFLLYQTRQKMGQDVWMYYKGNASVTTDNTVDLPRNAIDGWPIIKTDKINDKVVIKCKPNPRYIPWVSGKAMGYGKVNGKRPFFSHGAGKADMINVPADVVFIPDTVRHTGPPIVDIQEIGFPKGGRVKVRINQEKKTIDFYSDFMDTYIWFTDWYSDWKESTKTYKASMNEPIEIKDPIELIPENLSKDYRPDRIQIEEVEVTTNNPFVKVWANETKGEKSGLFGTYYSLPIEADMQQEEWRVKGDYREKVQPFIIKDYMDEVKVAIEDSGFTVLDVKQGGQILPASKWSIVEGNKVKLTSDVVKASSIEIRYKLGSIDPLFTLRKPVKGNAKVYVNGKELSKDRYRLSQNRLNVDESVIKLHDWVQVQAFDVSKSFDTKKIGYMGEVNHSQIDFTEDKPSRTGNPNLKDPYYEGVLSFFWKDKSPLKAIQAKTVKAMSQPIKAASVPFQAMNTSSTHASFSYKVQLELVYPASQQIDIRNFTNVWEEFNVGLASDNQEDVGDWAGPPAVDRIYNYRNNNKGSGFYNPNHVDYDNYYFSFKVQSISDWDNDVYGAFFRYSPVTHNYYSLEWDAGGTAVNGIGIYRNICRNPQDYKKSALQYSRALIGRLEGFYWGENTLNKKTPNRAMTLHSVEVRAIQNQFIVLVNGVEKLNLRDTTTSLALMKGAFGPYTRSQPETIYSDLAMAPFKKDVHEVSFKETKERQLINQNQFIETQINPTQTYNAFKSIIEKTKTDYKLRNDEVYLQYNIAADTSDHKVYFKESSSDKETNRVVTYEDKATVYSLIRGLEETYPSRDLTLPSPPHPGWEDIDLDKFDNIHDGFTIQWRGYIYAPVDGLYDFKTMATNGVRLSIGGKSIINEWDDYKFKESTGSIQLKGDTWHPINIQFYKRTGQAMFRMLWKRPGQSFKRIGPSFLAPYLGYVIFGQVKSETPLPWNPLVHNGHYYNEHNERYLYAEKISLKRSANGSNLLYVEPRPRQGSPVIVRTKGGKVLRKVSFYQNGALTLENREVFRELIDEEIYATYRGIDEGSLSVRVDGRLLAKTEYAFDQNESKISLANRINYQTVVEIRYRLLDSYIIDMNEGAVDGVIDRDRARIQVHTNLTADEKKDMEVIYEKQDDTPFYHATETILNPVLTNRHKGFLYLSERTNVKASKVNVHVSPKKLSSKGKEPVTITAEVLDQWGNPCEGRSVSIYRGTNRISTAKSNQSGEVYILDRPPINTGSATEYRVVCDDIEARDYIEMYGKSQVKSQYLEMKSTSSLIKADASSKTDVTVTLRDEHWYVVANTSVSIEFIDTYGAVKTETHQTNASGQVRLAINGANQKTGHIFIKASKSVSGGSITSNLAIRVMGK